MVAAPAYSEHDVGNPVAALEARLVKAEDTLNRIAPSFPARFSFSWHDRPVAAVVSPGTRGRRLLSLEALLGYLPFTAEDSDARLRALETMSALACHTLDEVVIVADGGIRLRMETWIDEDVSGSVLIEALTVVLIGAEDSIAELCRLLR